MHMSRTKKLNHFYSLCDKHATVLDVGVTSSKMTKQINLFLNSFRLNPWQYTGLAIEKMDTIAPKHPGKQFVEYNGDVFPFKDNAFDWTFSNAVIEHVGTRKDQIHFVNEMMRVSKNTVFTTPNKYFPIESHTDVFFKHWFDEYFLEWRKRNKSYWAGNNLVLLGQRDLESILQCSNATTNKIIKNRILGWTMTFTVVCSA